MAAAPQPSRRTTKRPPAKKQAAKAAGGAGAGAVGSAPATPAPPGAVADGLSVNQWLNELQGKPLRIEVFDRWWEFKQPTGGRALAWDSLLTTKGIRAALASMMFDETPAPDRTFTDPAGVEHAVEGAPGSAAADQFLAAATDWVIPAAAEEFWNRMERAIFGPGEASAS